MKEKVRIGKEEIEKMMENSREVMKLTLELNTKYNSAQEIVELMSKITGKEVDKSFAFFPPFNTDYGENITFGKNVFLNSGCKFQDQGGITIGHNVLIGHNVVLATLDHNTCVSKGLNCLQHQLLLKIMYGLEQTLQLHLALPSEKVLL